MARLAVSSFFLLSLFSLSLARLTPESESTSVTSVDFPGVKSEPESSDETSHYIVIPVERFSEGQSFENLPDLGFSLRYPIGHGRLHHHQHHWSGGFGHRFAHRFGHRFMADRGRDIDVNPSWMKPDGEWIEMPHVPLHMKHGGDKEMEKGEEFVKADRVEEPEEDEMTMQEMEKLRELMKKMRKKCRKHRMEREMRMSHEHHHEREEKEDKEERGMKMPFVHHEREEREMRMPHRYHSEREEREMHMPHRHRHEREENEEREMHMPILPHFEKEEKVEKEEGGVLEQVWEFINRF